MTIAVTEEHQELHRAVRGWAQRHCTRQETRAALESQIEERPEFWTALADQGWLGLAVPERRGGQGFGVLELVVACEEMGRALAPGPFLPTVLAATLLAGAGSRSGGDVAVGIAIDRLLSGEWTGCVGFGPAGALTGTVGPDGSLAVSGEVPAVLGAGLASVALVPVVVAPDGAPHWCATTLRQSDGSLRPGVTVSGRQCLDPTRRSAPLGLTGVVVEAGLVLDLATADVLDLVLVVSAAELVGSARWCLEAAAEHARTREQFGRTIGQNQGVKHRLANLLMAAEQTSAAVWDAATALDGGDADRAHLAAATAGALALDLGVRAARDAIQVLGGMGFTWEHDAHLHLRRSATLRQLLGGAAPQRLRALDQRMQGTRRVSGVELSAEVADPIRLRIAPLVQEVAAAPEGERHRLLGERGLLFPQWPVPYGRHAGPTEQLVIDELMAAAGLQRPSSDSSVWALATIISHGTPDQQERWALATLRRELQWCQLFSEPGAGSDLAALSTRAERIPGGWSLTGNKVWTSWGATADLGICLARTNPEAPKHRGITYFAVDMRANGVDIRPLREMTGDYLFNEVFLDHVVVPDRDVIGAVDEGWGLARSTLAVERLGRSSVSEMQLDDIVDAVRTTSLRHDAGIMDSLGRAVVDAMSLSAMDDRMTLRSVAGQAPGGEASIRKLLVAEHDQRVGDLGVMVTGELGVYADGELTSASHAFLHRLCLTISGGTSEIQRNLIGERLLGLARDREPGAHGGHG